MSVSPQREQEWALWIMKSGLPHKKCPVSLVRKSLVSSDRLVRRWFTVQRGDVMEDSEYKVCCAKQHLMETFQQASAVYYIFFRFFLNLFLLNLMWDVTFDWESRFPSNTLTYTDETLRHALMKRLSIPSRCRCSFGALLKGTPAVSCFPNVSRNRTRSLRFPNKSHKPSHCCFHHIKLNNMSPCRGAVSAEQTLLTSLTHTVKDYTVLFSQRSIKRVNDNCTELTWGPARRDAPVLRFNEWPC